MREPQLPGLDTGQIERIECESCDLAATLRMLRSEGRRVLAMQTGMSGGWVIEVSRNQNELPCQPNDK